MSQFSPRIYFNEYRVTARPNDNFRRHLIPRLNLGILPYFNGADILFDLSILPIKRKTTLPILKYSLYLSKKRGNALIPIASNTIANVTHKAYKTTVSIGHFSFTDEYKLDMEIEYNGKAERLTIADFEIKSRASAQLLLIGFLLGLIATVIGYFIGR